MKIETVTVSESVNVPVTGESILTTPAGVVSIDSPVTGTLTDSETVTVSIFNYGENDISNFDVSFELNSGGVVTETYTGTIATGETAVSPVAIVPV